MCAWRGQHDEPGDVRDGVRGRAVRGVRGVRGDEAGDRRAVVVDHVVRTGLITERDLAEVRDALG